jgi:hypothetical protein
MINSPADSGQPMLNGSFVHSVPESATTYIRKLLFGVNLDCAKVSGEVDDQASIGGRGAREVVTSACLAKYQRGGTMTARCEGDLPLTAISSPSARA